jgi:hypothetical protein
MNLIPKFKRNTLHFCETLENLIDEVEAIARDDEIERWIRKISHFGDEQLP